MPRFVILEHDHPRLHWDLMLETGQFLRSWRLDSPPDDGRTISAICLAAHRGIYLDYEGPVSGNRGRVSRWDGGVYSLLENGEDRVSAIIQGKRFLGTLVLAREKGDAWLLMCSATAAADDP